MSVQQQLDSEAIEVIRNLGGNAKTAEICDVSPAAVSQWRLNGIPKTQRKFLLAAHPAAFCADRQEGVAQ